MWPVAIASSTTMIVCQVGAMQPDPNAGAHRVYSGFREGKYVHSDMAWDISRNSLASLERIVEEVLMVVDATIDEGFLHKGMSA